MKIKILIVIALLMLLLGGVWLSMNKREISNARIDRTDLSKNSQTEETASTTPKTPQTKTLLYTENGFDPAVTHLSPGDSVIFKNQSQKTMELFSDTVSVASIKKGGEFKTTLTRVGVISVTDKLHPDKIGILLVQ